MDKNQLLLEIQKEFGTSERLAELVKQYAKLTADAALRRLYTTNEPAAHIRQSGYAEGIETFVAEITQAPAKVTG